MGTDPAWARLGGGLYMSWPLGYFGYDPSRKGTGKRLEYITQNGIMSMAAHGLSHMYS